MPLLKNKSNKNEETLVSVGELPEMRGKGENTEIEKKSNKFQSYINSVKIFLGNVYLTIPNVFSKTGWLGGIMLYSLVAVLNTYTMT